MNNIHTNAATLILAAAEKSGLLREVAEVLCFADKKLPFGKKIGSIEGPNPGDRLVVTDNGLCIPCEVLRRLSEAFDDHICLPGIVLDDFYGDGSINPSYSDEELAPYLVQP